MPATRRNPLRLSFIVLSVSRGERRRLARRQRDERQEQRADERHRERQDHDPPPSLAVDACGSGCEPAGRCASPRRAASRYAGHAANASPSQALSVTTRPLGTSFFTGYAAQNDIFTSVR
jgi:hypothetical protein